MNTCRFCKTIRHGVDADRSMLRYGRGHRNYACWACYLDAGKQLEALPTATLNAIPWKLVRDRHLETVVCDILTGREKRRAELAGPP
jgi:hypothetical protein